MKSFSSKSEENVIKKGILWPHEILILKCLVSISKKEAEIVYMFDKGYIPCHFLQDKGYLSIKEDRMISNKVLKDRTLLRR